MRGLEDFEKKGMFCLNAFTRSEKCLSIYLSCSKGRNDDSESTDINERNT